MGKRIWQSVKSIFELRYDPDLLFYDKLYGVAKKLQDQGDYPHWRTTGTRVKLLDPEKGHCSLIIDFNRIVFSQDILGAHNKERLRILKALKAILGDLEIKQSLPRVGLRRKYLIAVDMDFSDLVELFRKKFLHADKRFAQGIMPQVTDALVVLENRSSSAAAVKWMQIAPIPKSQLAQRFLELDEDNFVTLDATEILKEYPENAIMVDCDYAQAKLKPEEAEDFYSRARDEHEQLLDNISAYCFGID